MVRSFRFPTPVLPPFNKPFEVHFQLKKGLDAIATVGKAMKFANWKRAQERLIALSMMTSATGAERTVECVEAFMATMVCDCGAPAVWLEL